MEHRILWNIGIIIVENSISVEHAVLWASSSVKHRMQWNIEARGTSNAVEHRMMWNI